MKRDFSNRLDGIRKYFFLLLGRRRRRRRRLSIVT
jgi:hypothetical protein